MATLQIDDHIYQELIARAQSEGLSTDQLLQRLLSYPSATSPKLINFLDFLDTYSDELPFLVHVYDAIEQKIIFVNKTMREFYGLEEKDLTSEVIYERLHDDDRGFIERFRTFVETPNLSNNFQFSEYRIKNAEDQYRWINGYDFIVESQANSRAHIVLHIGLDMTQQQETRHLLNQIMDVSPVGICMLNAEGQVTFANQRLQDIIGYSFKTLSDDEQIDELYKTFDLEGTPLDFEDLAIYQAYISGKPVLNQQMRLLDNKTQKSVYIQLNAAPLLDKSGIVTDVMCVVSDMTEQIEAQGVIAEQQTLLKAIHTAARDAIFIIDDSGKYIDVNPAATEIYGYSRKEFLSSTTQLLLKDQAIEQETIDYLMEHGGFVEESRTYDYEGNVVWISASISPITIGNKKLLLGIFRDITQLREAKDAKLRAEMLRLDLEKEIEMKQLRSQFISMISHEFRTPMTIIMTSTALLRMKNETLSPEDRIERLKRIEKQIMILNSMVEDISTMNKSDFMKQELEISEVDIRKVIETAIEEAKIIYGNDVTVELVIDEGIGKLHLDYTFFQRIIRNLISNAVKYTVNHDTVVVKCHQNKHRLEISVLDYGIGIPPEAQNKIFDTFYRSSNVSNIPGTGLGLAIVKQAVDALNGSITFETREPQGTIFTVKIPSQVTEKH